MFHRKLHFCLDLTQSLKARLSKTNYYFTSNVAWVRFIFSLRSLQKNVLKIEWGQGKLPSKSHLAFSAKSLLKLTQGNSPNKILEAWFIFSGGHGGSDKFTNGEGGWSYYNPDAVIRVLDYRMYPTHSVVQLAATGSQGNTAASLPQLWTNQGHGQVQILPPLPLDDPCQSNCSAFGASCVILDPDTKKLSCLCPNGKILDAFNPQCSDGE